MAFGPWLVCPVPSRGKGLPALASEAPEIQRGLLCGALPSELVCAWGRDASGTRLYEMFFDPRGHLQP